MIKAIMQTIDNVSKKEVSWWITFIVFAVSITTFIIGNFSSLNQRVQANENDIKDIKVFIKDHTEAQNKEATQLGILDSNVKIIMGYFKLRPADDK